MTARRARAQRGLGRSQGTAAALAAGDDRLRRRTAMSTSARGTRTRVPTTRIQRTRPTTSAPRGSSISTRTADSSISGTATRWAGKVQLGTRARRRSHDGDVWIGDREEYRIVVYSGDGTFLKTMQMRNLVCALSLRFTRHPWMATGQDGQFLKLDRKGKVRRCGRNGMGIGPVSSSKPATG
jgi:hypothetical protein